MTFAELERTVKGITCGKIRARAEKINRSYVKIVVINQDIDQECEFTDRSSLFILSDDRIFSTQDLKTLDVGLVIEIVRDMMFSLHVHEFHEFFKFKEKTVCSPHLEIPKIDLNS
jgi:hypothetical protein